MGFDCKDCFKGKRKYYWGVGAAVVVIVAVIGGVLAKTKDESLVKPELDLETCPKLTMESPVADVKKHKKCRAANKEILAEYNSDMKTYMEARNEAD